MRSYCHSCTQLIPVVSVVEIVIEGIEFSNLISWRLTFVRFFFKPTYLSDHILCPEIVNINTSFYQLQF